MFRWGVLSTAKIGREQLLPAIVEAENGVLSAIASRDLSKAKALGDRFGARHVCLPIWFARPGPLAHWGHPVDGSTCIR